MKISLRQARRVEREIGTELDINHSRGHGTVAVSIYEDLHEKVNAANADTVKVLSREKSLLRIRFAIRKSIETENEVSGINALMNKEAELKATSKLLTALMTTELPASEYQLATSRFDALKAQHAAGNPPASRYGEPTDSITLTSVLRTETLDQLKAEAKVVQRALLETVDQLSALNAGRQIEISDEDVKFLEAASIIV